MARQHVLLCGASAVTVLASTVAVIVILHSVVVPHLQQQAHIGSLCTITDITCDHSDVIRTHDHVGVTHGHMHITPDQADVTRADKDITRDHLESMHNHENAIHNHMDIKHDDMDDTHDITQANKLAARDYGKSPSQRGKKVPYQRDTVHNQTDVETDTLNVISNHTFTKQQKETCSGCHHTCVVVAVTYYDLDHQFRQGYLLQWSGFSSGKKVRESQPAS